MELKHLAQWKKYFKMSSVEEKSYFQNPIPHQETVEACFQGTQVPCHEFVEKTIVECIIGEMYFHSEEK